jgi:hypothetical protein
MVLIYITREFIHNNLFWSAEIKSKKKLVRTFALRGEGEALRLRVKLRPRLGDLP